MSHEFDLLSQAKRYLRIGSKYTGTPPKLLPMPGTRKLPPTLSVALKSGKTLDNVLRLA
jgi:hypothetical protein